VSRKKCSWSGSQYLRGTLPLEEVGYTELVEAGVPEAKAAKLWGKFAKCPGCGRRLKVRKGVHSSARYWMLPQHNKEAS
jgi:hypothetical protein